MKTYQVIEKPVRFTAGDVLKLTDAQANKRLHSVKKIGKEKYEVVTQTEFKVGETLGFDGKIAESTKSIPNLSPIKDKSE